MSPFFREVLITLLTITLTVPVTIIIGIFFIFMVLPCKLYRSLVAYLAHIVDPNYGKLLTGLSATQHRDFDLCHIKPLSTQVVCFRLNGPLNFEQVRDEFFKRVVLKLNPKKSQPTLQYPELQQFLTTFMGYSFLKTDTNFNIHDHFHFVEKPPNELLTSQELHKIWESLMIKAFPPGKSPWEFLIYDNYIPDNEEIQSWSKSTGSTKNDHYWIAMLRIHHSIADGFSIQSMLAHLADEVYMPKFSNKMTSTQRLLLNLRALLFGSYDTASRAIRYLEGYHALHRPIAEQSNEYFVVESKLIPMTRVKLLKDKFRVAFTAILVAAISGGIRKFLMKNSLPLPQYISTAIPFATPEHSDGFGNEFSLATVGFGVHLNDPQKRVEYVKKQMNLLACTSWIKMLDIFIDCFSSFPIRYLRMLTRRSVFSSSYSTQPGPLNCLKAFNSKLLEICFSIGTGADSLNFGLSSVTYNQNFRVTLFIDKNLVQTREKANELISLIVQEFDVLEAYYNPKTLRFNDNSDNSTIFSTANKVKTGHRD